MKIGTCTMNRFRRLSMLIGLAALSGVCFAPGTAVRAAAAQMRTTPGPAAAPAPQGLPKICLDVHTSDHLTEAFADRLRETVAASGTLSLASTTDTCDLQLHVPGNLLRFETAGAVMVGTVVIVTSAAGRYLSTSISACRASDLKPCAVRAVAVAKLALLLTSSDGT
jgi:hypothetical protein